MVEVDPYQLLQIIGLSLPFLALYLTVLVEIHKLPKPIQVSSAGQPSKPVELRALTENDSEWAGTVTLSYAYQRWDFVFALASIVFILLSGMAIVLSLGGDIRGLRTAAFVFLMLSYGAVAVSVLYTLSFCYSNFSPSDD